MNESMEGGSSDGQDIPDMETVSVQSHKADLVQGEEDEPADGEEQERSEGGVDSSWIGFNNFNLINCFIGKTKLQFVKSTCYTCHNQESYLI